MTERFTPRYLVPSALTSANIVAGFLSMMAAADGRFDLAVYLLVAAVFLDVFDGLAARMLGATSKFGQELDSISDALSFGAAPAFLVYHASLSSLGTLGVVVVVVYLLAAVLRLARFNVVSDEHAKDDRSVGAPTPVGAGYLMAATLMRDHLSSSLVAIVVVVMAIAMISRIPIPQIKGGGLVTFTILVGIVTYLAVVVRPGWPTVICWNLWNLVILAAARFEDRKRAA